MPYLITLRRRRTSLSHVLVSTHILTTRLYTCTIQLAYKPKFGTLVRKKSLYPVDGIPFSLGIACILKQLHPAVTLQLIAYLGQYVRNVYTSLWRATEGTDNKFEVPDELKSVLVFLEQFCNFCHVSKSSYEELVPSALLASACDS